VGGGAREEVINMNNNNKEETFPQWLQFYRPVSRQETVIFEAINQVIDDLKWLLALPRLSDADKNAIKATIAKWTAVRQLVVEVAGPGTSPAVPAGGRNARNEHGDHGEEHEEDLEQEPPTCEVHQLPMVRVEGRRGAFWSCHQRMPDGSFCSYRPSRE